MKKIYALTRTGTMKSIVKNTVVLLLIALSASLAVAAGKPAKIPALKSLQKDAQCFDKPLVRLVNNYTGKPELTIISYGYDKRGNKQEIRRRTLKSGERRDIYVPQLNHFYSLEVPGMNISTGKVHHTDQYYRCFKNRDKYFGYQVVLNPDGNFTVEQIK